MDEEEHFAKLLSQSTSAPAPSWSTSPGADDPWANPFSDTPSTNPFATTSTPFGTSSTYPSDSPTVPHYPAPESPREEKSPYVQKLEDDRVIIPDPPSVIAARESYQPYESYESPPITSSDPFTTSRSPFESPVREEAIPAPHPQAQTQARRGLPSDLIDEDLLAASDPSLSLKKAFVKSTSNAAPKTNQADSKPKAYVFSPKKEAKQATTKEDQPKEQKPKGGDAREPKEKPEQPKEDEDGSKEEKVAESGETVKPDEKAAEAKEEKSEAAESTIEEAAKSNEDTPTTTSELTPTNSGATSIPLPISTGVTPTPTRPSTPPPPAATAPEVEVPEPSSVPAAVTPSVDRVAVSPLDPPPNEADYGFQSLAIGGSSFAPPPPSKSPAKEGDGWSATQTTTPSSSRFGGKGWGALDEEDDDSGLFGRGGPSARSSNAWGGNDGEGGWGEPGVASLSSPGTSNTEPIHSPPARPVTPPKSRDTPTTTRTPRTPKVLSKPLFQISVGDPTRLGDPVRGYTVYTVRTRTTSPHYRKGEFSVLRRFSDFLWLFETLSLNNPGVIVPPVPDKHPFGRFQDTFIETRRLALQRCLTKITGHPVLQLDPDLRLFLESDHFATDSKNRRAEIQSDKSGLLSGWTGPKFVEQDDWFDSRRAFLDSLESQLKSLSKSIEVASKSRLDMAISMGDFASAVTALSDSDLGSAMCSALARLADLAHREKEQNEEQAKSEVVHLLNLSDEYIRFISSVRIAFASRVKCYERWQAGEREVVRLRQAREKARQQGKLGDRVNQSLAEIGDAERRSRDASAEFDSVSKLVKNEFGRFERERVEEFKRVLERYLDGQIVRQKDLIEAWEEYHGVVLKMVQKAQGPGRE